ncbi:MAG: GlmU family protein [Bacteroidota bacterium]
MNYILFDDSARKNLLPLTFTRPVADIRIGIFTIREKWEKALNARTSNFTENYLQNKFPLVKGTDNILINGSICPNKKLVNEINELRSNQVLVYNSTVVAIHVPTEAGIDDLDIADLKKYEKIASKQGFLKIDHLWDIFSKNGEAISQDFELLTSGRKSQTISETNKVIGNGSANIFIEEGAKIECSVLNASAGPVYIGKHAEIMEGCLVRGPFALCENSVLKMGAKIYGPTTIGSFSKVGGEINNCVILGYSNKAHDGFLGNSVIGEWCNIGADSNNSNLKNNYSEVKLWNYSSESFEKTGLQFCGMVMGDHSKCGINTMFNTGTIVGVNTNIFGSGFHHNFIPSFSWGKPDGLMTYKLSRAIEVAEKVYERRGMEFNDVEKEILSEIFTLTMRYRKR